MGKDQAIVIPSIPDWDDFYLNVAEHYSKRAQCLRRQYAAIIVDPKRKMISAGYNGSPRKVRSSVEKGTCYRLERNIPTGSNYEVCRSIHAEMNAILRVGLEPCQGASMYLYGWDVQNKGVCGTPPCLMCVKFIVQAEIKEVVMRTPQNGIRRLSLEFLKDKLNADDFSYPY